MRLEDTWTISIEFQSALLLYSSIPSAVSVLGILPPPRSNVCHTLFSISDLILLSGQFSNLEQEKISLCLLGDHGTDFLLARQHSKQRQQLDLSSQ
ncbi:hypothetical protein C8J56DRAFT_1059762 [Mycena floridula]|nr:hypothetical protein C8J56DRAFT_1059762 [Mycena floridula]